MNASTTRLATRERLNAEVDRERTRADAYVELARLINTAPTPVARYAPHWGAVRSRLLKDAAAAIERADHARARLADLDAAALAADAWIPKRGE